ncbi:phage portal protein [Rhizobium sp. S9]|nr:phage portal protein [Rhizobium sp. S9]
MWPFKDRVAAETRATMESPSVSLSDPNAWRTLFSEWHSVAGVVVNYETALEVPAVWCAINFIAGTIASLPLQVFRKGEKGRETVENDPLYGILHDAPNDELTSFMWRKAMMVSVLLRGRGVSFIERNKAGRVMNIWPLDVEKLTIERNNGRKSYRYRDGERTVTYAASEVIDLTFMLKPDGITHVDPVSKLKGAVGLALALDEYARKFFANGGVPPLALYGPMPSPAAATRAAQDVEKAVKDANAERRNVMIMPAGHELKPVGVDPQKSQMEEARRFQIEEIARIFDIPPVFLQDLTHGTFSNTEQQDLHFVKHTLTQWIKAWEQELNLKLFTARNKSKFVEFNVDGLLRGDFKTRMDGYATAIQNAINTPDEVRGMENWPAQGGEAAKLHIQGATVPLGMQSTINAPKPANNNNQNDGTQAA